MVKALLLLIPALFMPFAMPARAATTSATARTPDAVVTCAFTVVKLGGNINRDVYPYRGTLTVRGTLAVPDLFTLQAFTNVAQPSLLTLNNSKTIASGAFVRSNKTGTLLTFRSRIKKEKWLLTTTLRLKKTALHVHMTVCNEADLDHGLGTANQDTDGWLAHTVAATVTLQNDDQTLIGLGTYSLREKSQMDKRTIYK